MTAAGWNHRYFVRGMFVLAAALALIAIFWQQIRLQIPDRTDDVFVFLATSRIAWFVMFVLCIGIIGTITRARNAYSPIFNYDQNLKQIRNRTFRNETVEIDGREFIDCTFDNVQFRYDGKAIPRFTNVHFKLNGTYAIASQNSAIAHAMIILDAIQKGNCGKGLPFEIRLPHERAS